MDVKNGALAGQHVEIKTRDIDVEQHAIYERHLGSIPNVSTRKKLMPLILAHLKARLSHDDMILVPLDGAIYADRLKGITEFKLAAGENGLVLVAGPLAGSGHAPFHFSDYNVMLPLNCTQQQLDKARALVAASEKMAVEMVDEIDRDRDEKTKALAAFRSLN